MPPDAELYHATVLASDSRRGLASCALMHTLQKVNLLRFRHVHSHCLSCLLSGVNVRVRNSTSELMHYQQTDYTIITGRTHGAIVAATIASWLLH